MGSLSDEQRQSPFQVQTSKRKKTKRETHPSNNSSDKIRSKLLHKLGIDLARTLDIYQHTQPVVGVPLSTSQTRRIILRDVASFNEPLKYDDEETCEEPLQGQNIKQEENNPITPSKTASKEGGIKFDDQVSVVPIPGRDEYSDRVKTRIWSGAEEIYENAQRNALEFAAEGWDWRTVTEDDQM